MILVRRRLTYLPCAILVVMAGVPAALLAQYQDFQAKPVLAIRFDPVAQPLEPSELFEILPLKTVQPLSMSVVRASIDRLFATGRYADIQVDARPYQDGVIVTFVTKNSWFITGISIAGKASDPPNPGQLENVTRLELGQPFSEAELQRALESQKSLL